MFKNKYEFIEELSETARSVLGKEFEDCSPEEKYCALARLVAAAASDVRAAAAKK